MPNEEIRICYHTQEHRTPKLNKPVKCTRDDAWLGDGYYFWDDLDDARKWGITSKKRTGQYEVYKSRVNCENILDTVFNEEHYRFWLKQIEKTAEKLIKKTKMKPTLKEINDYFKERASWDDLDGIMFQDLPGNLDFLLVKPIEYGRKKRAFVYKKRIQIAIYKLHAVLNFDLFEVDDCM